MKVKNNGGPWSLRIDGKLTVTLTGEVVEVPDRLAEIPSIKKKFQTGQLSIIPSLLPVACEEVIPHTSSRVTILDGSTRKVKKEIEEIDDIERLSMLALDEQTSKNRTTVLLAIEERMNELTKGDDAESN